MAERPYLVDTSVINRWAQAAVARRLDVLFVRGRLYSCRIVDLEVLIGERARDVPRAIEQRSYLQHVRITPEVTDRALEVLALLAERSHHKAAGPADLVIAATAEAAGLPVLHYDRGFDVIAEVTGQEVEWVAPPGSLDPPGSLGPR